MQAVAHQSRCLALPSGPDTNMGTAARQVIFMSGDRAACQPRF